jgi:hypothetical protein
MKRRYDPKAEARRRRLRMAEALCAEDRCRAVLLHGNCRSVLVADDPAELLKLRALVWKLHMERRISRSETPRDRYPRS